MEKKTEIICIIAGGRDFSNYKYLEEKCYEVLTPYLKNGVNIIIREGEAKGADTLAVRFALENNFILQRYKADWSLGPSGGYVRNKEMAFGKNGDKQADLLIAFWNGKSKGTKHMINVVANELVFCSYHIFYY